ncbi:MAG: hypothetical protein P4N41_20440 [Negativicutes bacterium]|nr:hypothetical protein [Negativicutes bacterium]
MDSGVLWHVVWYLGELCFCYLFFYHFFPATWTRRIRSTVLEKERKRMSLQCAVGIVLFHILFYPLAL